MKVTSRHVKALVSIAFLAMLFALVRKGEFVAMLKRVDPLYFALSFLIAAAQISVSCAKWQVLVNLYEKKVGFGLLMKNYLIGYYFSNLLPSNVGGDVVRSYHAGRHIGSQTHAAISVFMERFTGSIYMLLLVLFMPLIRPGLYREPAVIIASVFAAGLLAAFAWIAWMDQPLARGVEFAIRVLRGLRARTPVAGKIIDRIEGVCLKIQKKAEGIHEKLTATIGLLKKDRKAAFWVVAWTVIFYALTWVNVYWAFRTFGNQVPLRDIAALLPTAMLAGSIPITLGSLGIVEGSYVFYFHLVGAAPAATLLMGLFLRFKLIIVGVVGFLNYLTYRHEKYDYAELERES
jgi:glycosyltransferase 2 family protein